MAVPQDKDRLAAGYRSQEGGRGAIGSTIEPNLSSVISHSAVESATGSGNLVWS